MGFYSSREKFHNASRIDLWCDGSTLKRHHKSLGAAWLEVIDDVYVGPYHNQTLTNVPDISQRSNLALYAEVRAAMFALHSIPVNPKKTRGVFSEEPLITVHSDNSIVVDFMNTRIMPRYIRRIGPLHTIFLHFGQALDAHDIVVGAHIDGKEKENEVYAVGVHNLAAQAAGAYRRKPHPDLIHIFGTDFTEPTITH